MIPGRWVELEMDAIYTNGVALAGILQERLQDTEEFWLWLTSLGDPGTIFLLYFPLAYALRPRLGVTVLWIGLICEWLNVVFKWFLFGQRPFWWVNESGLHQGHKLRQFPATCETGPGSPSGHCMITGAALWPVAVYLSNHSVRGNLRYVPLFTYALLMTGIAVSRILILAHFPHQVVAGIITGVLLGYVFQSYVPYNRSFRFYTLASLFLLNGALLAYWIISAFGADLSWSINLATKWCSKSEWIHLETRPFSSVTRSSGNLLGLGLALHCSLYERLRSDNPSRVQNVISLLLSILFLKLPQSLPLPISPPILFYVLNLLRHALCPLTVIILAPFLVRGLNSGGGQKRD